MKKVALLGSTGSIGKSTLSVIKHLGYSVVSLAAHSDIKLLEEQIHQFQPTFVSVFDEKKAKELKIKCPHVTIGSGREGLIEAALQEVDIVVVALTGKEALFPTVASIEKKKTIAIASKEVLVSGGKWLMDLAKKHGATLLTIDSEHNAIFQCLHREKKEDVKRLILTASGGPFRNYSLDEIKNITVEQALHHPTWKMGSKITIDSSTLMNKALEVIEAHYLFDMPPEKIEVVIHPQSIIHSFVEFIDGSILSVMNEPNMINPIQYALTFPERKMTSLPFFDFTKHEKLEFFTPDHEKFGALRLASFALREGKSYPCFLNGVNDVLVFRFLNKEISWKGITDRLEHLLNKHKAVTMNTLDAILSVDEEARKEALTI